MQQSILQGKTGKERVYINQSTKVLIVACALLYLLGGIFHYVDMHYAESLPFRLSAISYLAYCTICILAFIYTRKNLPQPITRRYMLIGISLLLAWEFAAMAGELIIPANDIVNRYLWYGYYIPAIGIPNMILLVALNYNRDPNDEIPRFWYYSYLPTLAGVILVFTNDNHRLAFTFPNGIENFHIMYKYNIGYYIIIAWIFILLIGGVTIMYSRARTEVSSRGIGLIALGFILTIVYFTWYHTGRKYISFVNDMYGVSEVFMGILVVSMAGCISNGLIRSNFNFQELFECSNLGAILVDKSGTIRYRTKDSVNPTKEEMDKAIDHNIYIDNNIRFQGEKLQSGAVFWADDMSEIKKLADELNEVHHRLEQENSLISAENQMIERRSKADEQNRLYNLMARGVEDELNKMEGVMKGTTPKDIDFKDKMALGCLYKSYIKRYCNLMLIRQDDESLHSFDLASSIRESLEYVKLNGIKTSYRTTGEGFFSADRIIFIYRLFQDVIEAVVTQGISILGYENLNKLSLDVALTIDDNLTLSMDLHEPYDSKVCEALSLAPIKARMEQSSEVTGEELTATKEDGVCRLSIRLPKDDNLTPRKGGQR